MIIGVMVAYQDAERIGDALASLRAVGCERLVVVEGAWRWFPRYGDGPESTDGTAEIARAYGAEVIEPPADGWPDEVTARNGYLVGKPGDWYLMLDTDERATGRLPASLDAPEGAYQLWWLTPGEADLRRVRLVQEDGSLRYQYAHWAMYRQGRLIDQAALMDDVAIDHVGRPGDTDRAQRKVAWYARSGAHEQAYLINGRAPAWAVEVEMMEKVAFRYVGGGAWVPGLPARDLLESEAAQYADVLAEHMATAQPVYEAVRSVSRARVSKRLDSVADGADSMAADGADEETDQ